MLRASKLTILDGVYLWPGALNAKAQSELVAEVLEKVEQALFYKPVMPGSGREFSVEETNFGSLGWISDRHGYRYEPVHPVTKKSWPAIPALLLDLWDATTGYAAPP